MEAQTLQAVLVVAEERIPNVLVGVVGQNLLAVLAAVAGQILAVLVVGVVGQNHYPQNQTLHLAVVVEQSLLLEAADIQTSSLLQFTINLWPDYNFWS